MHIKNKMGLNAKNQKGFLPQASSHHHNDHSISWTVAGLSDVFKPIQTPSGVVFSDGSDWRERDPANPKIPKMNGN